MQIIATAQNGVSAACTLVVRSLAISQVVIKKNYIEVDEGKTASVSAAILPRNARYKAVSWSSSDPGIAAVSTRGRITAYRPGSVQIIATAHNGISAACTLVVRSLAVASISLKKTELSLAAGRSTTLKAVLLPKNTRYKTITWVSSNPSVASVTTSGRVRAIGPGTATITATAHNGLFAQCIVTVK